MKMFGAFKGIGYRSKVSHYWSGLARVPRKDLARITEIHRQLLNDASDGGLDVHDAGVRMCIACLKSVLASEGSKDVLAMAYGPEYIASVMRLAAHGGDFIASTYKADLMGFLALTFNHSSVYSIFAEEVVEKGAVDQGFIDKLCETPSVFLDDKMHGLVKKLPSWLMQ